MKGLQIPSPLSFLKSDILRKKEIELIIKRDDLIHSDISGNKWRKLALNFKEAIDLGYNQVLTFGGVYSNHIAACAKAGEVFGLKTVGVIRGDEGVSNPSIDKARSNGMIIDFVSRSEYQQKQNQEFQKLLLSKHGKSYIIPEGGANENGVKGCESILEEINFEFDIVSLSAGTGTTASGILRQLSKQDCLVFSALKNGGFLKEEILKWQNGNNKSLHVIEQYHFGGYAKLKPELLSFMKRFHEEYGIALDQVYTAKAMYGLFEMISADQFKKGSRILFIHTGGLQGNSSIMY